MKRRDFLRATGRGAAASALVPHLLAGRAAGAPSQDRLNVLFIAVDDLRPQLACYGHRHMLSPNIDRLAAEGVLFERAYCQVPVCGASRASLLTGIRPTPERFLTYHTWAEKDAPDAVTLPEHFRRHGYVTVSRGKVFHHRRDTAGRSWTNGPWGPQGAWGGRGYLLEANRTLAAENRRRPGCGPPTEAADAADSAYPDGRLADRAVADLERFASTDEPFFLAVGFHKPHLPFNAPKRYWDKYRRDEIDLADNPFRPKGCPDRALHNWGELRAYVGIPPKGPLPDDQARTLVHGYYACTSYADAQVGRLLAALGRLGIRDRTVVALWGDHGWQLGEHGLWCKHSNFETSLHAPLLVSAPGVPGGRRTRALVEFVDIYPTLCELAGLARPEHLEGTSAAPLLASPDRPWKGAALSRYRGGDSIRTDRYRYTRWPPEGDRSAARMLYDHATDPGENVNVAERPENREVVERLERMLQTGWQAARPA